MYDKEIILDSIWQKRYRKARFFVYLFFVLLFIYAGYLILFPSAKFIFSFPTPDSSKNTVVEPRSENGNLIKNGRPSEKGKMIFDANPLGNFSEVEINFTLEKKSAAINSGSVSVRKSFRSFFYPEGEKTEISENTQFAKLLSTKDSVFLVSQDKIWPIADATTFESMGWDWSDVAAASSEEIGSYEKQKLFALRTPHPSGTVFFDQEAGKYFLIENGQKREVENPNNLSSRLSMNPIIAEKKGLEISNRCEIKPSWKFLRKYKCVISIQEMQGLLGNDYQFEVDLDSKVKIRNLEVTFKKNLNLENLQSSIAILKNRTAANYGKN